MAQENANVCSRIRNGSFRVAQELNQAVENRRILADRRLNMQHTRDEIERNIIQTRAEVLSCSIGLRSGRRSTGSDAVNGLRVADCLSRLTNLRRDLQVLERSLAVAEEQLRNMDNRIAANERDIQQKERVLQQFSDQKRQHACS